MLAGNMVFNEDFNLPAGSQPNSATWTTGYAGTDPNNGAVVYTNDPGTLFAVDDPGAFDGKAMALKLWKNADGSYHSAKITTFVDPIGGNLAYGHIEARILLPGGPNGQGDGIWPAFWMLGTNIGQVSWPACGEVDIMEHWGNWPNMTIGTIHGPGYTGGNGVANFSYYNATPFYYQYHTFAIDWGPNYINFYVDGNYTGTRSPPDLPGGAPWEFNHPFYIILNVAVSPGLDSGASTYPKTMLVDYVRAWSTSAVANGVIPSGWYSNDIGSPAVPGVNGFDGVNWTVGGSGSDIWNTADQFHYLRQNVTGDFTIVGRLGSMWGGGNYAKAGLMIRDGIDPSAPYAMIDVTPNRGLSGEGTNFEYRAAAGASSVLAASAATGGGAEWLKLVRVGDVFTAYYSADGLTWTQDGGAVTVPMSQTVSVGIAVDSNISQDLNVAYFTNVSVLQSGWADADIGGPTLAGSADYNMYTGAWTVAGGGADIWGTTDQFNFASHTLTGDGSIVARVASQSSSDPWAKAGVMIRDGAAADAPFADVVATPASGISFQWRATKGGQALGVQLASVAAPVWVKLTRSGNYFSPFYSTDGMNWVAVATSQSIAMNSSAMAGLAVDAHSSAGLNTATFTGVQVTPLGWTNADIGSPLVAGAASLDPVANTWTVFGGGADIWGTADQFNFTSRYFTGAGSIVARVMSVANSDPWAKAGVMLRGDLSAGAAMADVSLTAGNGLLFEWRATSGAAAAGTSVFGVTGPVWVKLTRTGSSVSGFYSSDGSTWTQIGAAQTIALGALPRAGMAVTAHNNSALTTAVFTGVSTIHAGYADGSVVYGPTQVGLSAPLPTFTAGVASTPVTLQLRDQLGNPMAANSLTVPAGGVLELSGPAAAGGNRVDVTSGNLGTILVSGTGQTVGRIAGDTSGAGDVLVTGGSDLTATSIQQGTLTIGAGSKVTLASSSATAASSSVTVALQTTSSGGAFLDGQGQAISSATIPSGAGSATFRYQDTAFGAPTLTATASGMTALVQPASVIPAGWTASDIGAPAVTGAANYAATTGVWTVSGGGSDIWNAADQFQFVSRAVSGDVSIVAQVASLQATDPWAKAGLMLRGDTSAGSAFANVNVTAANGIVFEWRSSAGAAATSSAAITGVTAPQWLKLTRSGTSISAFNSPDGAAWTLIGTTQNIQLSTNVRAGMAVTAHNNALLNSATFANVSIAPPIWTDADIGAPAVHGLATFDGASATIHAGGTDVFGAADQFNYLYRTFTGDVTLVAQVTGLLNTGTYAKAGLMFRDSNAPNSDYGFVFVTPSNGQPGNGANFEYRSTSGGSAAGAGSAPGVTAPQWLKLVRSGNTLTAYQSQDGATWTQVGASETFSMGATLEIGLAVDANSPTALNVATFSNVSVVAGAH